MNPKAQDWENALIVEVMEDYVRDARGLKDAYSKDGEIMRAHFEKLKQFISRLLKAEYERGKAEQDKKAWALATKAATELWIPDALKAHDEGLSRKVLELSEDPPLESNERRRGYHQAVDDFLRLLTHPTKE
jgi:hypothetical protein